jgi:hypothetical protein
MEELFNLFDKVIFRSINVIIGQFKANEENIINIICKHLISTYPSTSHIIEKSIELVNEMLHTKPNIEDKELTDSP